MTIPDYWLMRQLFPQDELEEEELKQFYSSDIGDSDSEYHDGYDCADLYDDENPEYKED